MVYEDEPAIDIFQFHKDHWAWAIIASKGYKSFAMGVHHHEHTSSPVGDYLSVVTSSVEYCITALGGEDRYGGTPA